MIGVGRPGYAKGSPILSFIISCPLASRAVAGTTTSLIAYSIWEARDVTGICFAILDKILQIIYV